MAVHQPPRDQVERDECIRVIGYARVNGAPADQTRLLGLQWERMRRFTREHAGWTIVGEFSDITTRRSANMLPGLRQAMAEAAAGSCDIVLVDSLDRVSRLCCHFAAVLDELTRAGVTLWSTTEPIIGAARGGLVSTQALVAMGERERRQRRRA